MCSQLVDIIGVLENTAFSGDVFVATGGRGRPDSSTILWFSSTFFVTQARPAPAKPAPRRDRIGLAMTPLSFAHSRTHFTEQEVYSSSSHVV